MSSGSMIDPIPPLHGGGSIAPTRAAASPVAAVSATNPASAGLQSSPVLASPKDAGSLAAAKASSASAYLARTMFDAATGKWAFIIERHPPEVGILVAKESGFPSHYEATMRCSADLRTTFSLEI